MSRTSACVGRFGALLVLAAMVPSGRVLGQCAGTWVPGGLPTLTDMNVKALAVFPRETGFGLIVAGGSNAPSLVRVLDGDSWAPLGGGVTWTGGSGTVYAVTVLADGSVVIGGSGFTAGGFTGQSVLRWDGSAWVPMGGGLGASTVRCLLPEPDGGVVAGGDVLSRWDPAANQWSALGNGPCAGTIHAITRRSNGDIVAAGNTNICEWNGSSWTELGAADGQVSALVALPNGDIVAGGSFMTVNGVHSARVARTNGSAWFAMPFTPEVFFPTVYALAVAQNGDVIAGGLGGNLVRWNGSAWTVVGPPNAATWVEALAVVGSSGLVAGGDGFPPMRQQHIGRFAFPTADFDQDGDSGTDLDIEAFFNCLAGRCCSTCGSMDFDGDRSVGTDADIEGFFRVLAGASC